MSYIVKWSPSSKDEYSDILQYIESEFGLEAALTFLDKTDAVLDQVSSFPNIGVSTKKESVKKKVISSQTSLGTVH